MMRILIALFVSVGILATLAVGPAQAQTTGASSYFCSKHPGAAQCHKPPSVVPKTGGGGTYPQAGTGSVVTGLSTSQAQPAQLPRTGGGAPAPRGNEWVWLAALLALMGGLGLRLAISRT
jgi:hypothetical protein